MCPIVGECAGPSPRHSRWRRGIRGTALALAVTASALAAVPAAVAPSGPLGPRSSATETVRLPRFAPAPGAVFGLPSEPRRAARSDRARRPVDCAGTRCVALTFDDGPGEQTPELLGHLRRAEVRATFFVLGDQADRRPKFLKAIAADGHEIGSHSWSHPQLTALDPRQLASQIDRTADVVQRLTGQRPVLLRPPYGSYDKEVRRAAGGPIVLWDVDPEDWRTHSAKATTRRVLAAVEPGSIVLLHDIHPSTVEAVPKILAALEKKGYTPVTVSELLGSPRAGKVYFGR